MEQLYPFCEPINLLYSLLADRCNTKKKKTGSSTKLKILHSVTSPPKILDLSKPSGSGFSEYYNYQGL